MKRKCLNKLIALLITGSLLAGNLGLTAMAEEVDSLGEVTGSETIAEETVAEEGIALASDGVIASGVDGDLTWSISSGGVLTVSGTGDYEVNDEKMTPDWISYGTSITSAVIEVTGITNMQYMFDSCSVLKSVDFGNSDTSNVTNMAGMFAGCERLTSVDVSGFDTSNVTNMSYMFYFCRYLTDLDVSGFDTSNVTDMSDMFCECRLLTGLDVSGFDTSNVTDMSDMFCECRFLTSLDVSNFSTSNVTNMQYMFYDCSSLTSLDLSGFDTSNLMYAEDMFSGCSNLASLIIPAGWNASVDLPSVEGRYWVDGNGDVCESVITGLSETMTYGRVASGIDGDLQWSISADGVLTVSGVGDFEDDPDWITYKEDIVSAVIQVSGITSMRNMFYDCNLLETVDFSTADTSNVIDMSDMFCYCTSLTSLDLSGLDTGNVMDMSGMFWGCSGLTSLNLSGIDTGSVIDMYGMFFGCSGLTSLDLSGLDTANVTTMQHMFYGCSSLTGLDLSAFDTGNVTNMYSMFAGCYNLASLEISSFDTSSLTTMDYMFSNCQSLTSLDVSGFNTENVTTMSCLFYKCYSLTSLDLSNFSTSNVTDMWGMFIGCGELTSLDLSNFDTANLQYVTDVFVDCNSLTTLRIPANWPASVSLPSVEETYWENEDGDVCTSVASGLSAAMTYTRHGDSEENNVEELFSDIVSGSWYVSAVQYVYDSGLMSGKGEGLFDPTGKITRAEFVTTLYSMQGKPDVTYDATFSDVSSGQWYSNPIMWANKNEVVTGYANGKFGVSDAITREQLALMLYKYATVVCGYEDNTESGVLEQFADADSASSWAVHALEWAVTNGVMSGKGENLDPSGNATRAECAAMLRSFCVNVAG